VSILESSSPSTEPGQLQFVATLGALIAGLFRVPESIRDRPLTLWLFVAFFLLLRFKIYIDDHKYFADAKTRSANFKVGFLFGFVSWVFWAMGGYAMHTLKDAYFLVGVAITVSTIWIVAVALRKKKGAYPEQYLWLITNPLFVILLWALYSRNRPESDWLSWVQAVLALILVLLDLLGSNSIPELDR
jgi:hypothetical protein